LFAFFMLMRLIFSNEKIEYDLSSLLIMVRNELVAKEIKSGLKMIKLQFL
jgi:hypothetical protein